MKLRVLGCDGGRGLGCFSTSLLFNDHIMVDAGTIQSVLTEDEVLKITDVFLTHVHFDHIMDLPFLFSITFGKRKKPLRIHGSKFSLDALKKYVFNDVIWPDFARIPNADNPQYTLHEIEEGQSVTVDGLTFTPIDVDHQIPTVGYKIEDAQSSIVFSGDTGPCDTISQVANDAQNLKAVIMDLSFVKEEKIVARLSKHMIADDIKSEIAKIEQECDIYTFHFKMGMVDELEKDIAALSHFGKSVKSLRQYKEIIF